jgi:Flp pilus assembly pilin Flp
MTNLRLTASRGARSARARAWRLATRLRGEDHGQTTAEYGLVLLGAAAVAMALVAWATRSPAIGVMFDRIVGSLLDDV